MMILLVGEMQIITLIKYKILKKDPNCESHIIGDHLRIPTSKCSHEFSHAALLNELSRVRLPFDE